MSTASIKPQSLVSDPNFEPLKDYLIAATGLSYYRSRNAELSEHIGRHLTMLGLTDCLSYLRRLQWGLKGQEELDKLIEDLTIGETYFFRHPDLFTALEQSILPEVIERNAEVRRLRIWSAGSSIGAEAYTISILLKRRFAHRMRGWEVAILGTDINRSFLSRAAEGRFEDWALRGLSDELKQHCFSREGEYWMLKREFKEGVSFQYCNLVKDPYPVPSHNAAGFDVILCRNVMIYFSPPVIERIVGNMRRALVDRGWLLVGHAEHDLERFRDFRTVQFQGAMAYQRVDEKPMGTPGVHQCSSGVRFPEAPSQKPNLRAEASAEASIAIPGDLTSRETPLAQKDSPGELASLRGIMDQGAFEQAETYCRQLLKTHKLNPVFHLYHALILEQRGQIVLCEKALRRAIYLDRDSVLAHYYLGLTLKQMGRSAGAARSLRNALQLLETLDSQTKFDNFGDLSVSELNELTLRHLEALNS